MFWGESRRALGEELTGQLQEVSNKPNLGNRAPGRNRGARAVSSCDLGKLG